MVTHLIVSALLPSCSKALNRVAARSQRWRGLCRVALLARAHEEIWLVHSINNLCLRKEENMSGINAKLLALGTSVAALTLVAGCSDRQ